MTTSSLSNGIHTITATSVNSHNVTGNASISIRLTLPGGSIEVSYTNDTDVDIPDNYPTGVTSTIVVPESLTIADLSVDLNILHTWKSDMVVKLISPTGTEVTIFNREGGSDDNITGNFPLSQFNGENCAGTWTLWMADVDLYRGGTLDSWTINIEGE